MTDKPRLIERAFPLKQASLASVHEKNVRHGHISTLHIWPARRPLAACRAALLATLLPDPGTPEARRELCERIGGKVVEKVEKKKMPNGSIIERIKEETVGGVLNWIGTEPKSGGKKKINDHQAAVEHRERELAWFRDQIKKAHGGRAPRILDPFAGGGAIPLEAMRLGCEATAVDINPVAWFILKCTLEYPQKLAGKTHPLPDFIIEDEDFMEAFYKAHPHLVGRTIKTRRQKDEKQLCLFDKGDSGRIPRADLAWHVRAWGRWVLNHARRELAPFYPTYADFEPLDLKNPLPYENQPMRMVPLKEDGLPDIDALNAAFSMDYLRNKRNPRWVAKPTVAYLWARTVKCKNCRATVPLLKTRWLCRKEKKRVLLTMKPNADKSGVTYGIQNNVPIQGGNAAQRWEHDKRISEGTMSRAGAKCPCCGAIMMMQDIRIEGLAGRLNSTPTAVIIDGQKGKEYRLWMQSEEESAKPSQTSIISAFSNTEQGPIFEPLAPASTRSISCHLYGITKFRDFFTDRQHMCIGSFLSITNRCSHILSQYGYDSDFQEAIHAYQCIAIDRLVDYSNALCSWHTSREQMRNLLGRFSIPMVWDYCELSPLGDTSGGFSGALDWIFLVLQHFMDAVKAAPPSSVQNQSATKMDWKDPVGRFETIITDPPYYEAISYADLSELFYIVLRRTVNFAPFAQALMQKELEAVQHIHTNKNRKEEKIRYESLMTEAF